MKGLVIAVVFGGVTFFAAKAFGPADWHWIIGFAQGVIFVSIVFYI